METNITIEQVKQAIESIKDITWDDEAAHGKEDSLRDQVLQAIANGSPDSQELARLALTTNDIDFCRWCA